MSEASLKADGLTANQRHYRKHREKYRKRAKVYYENNKEKEKMRRDKYNAEHRDEIRAKGRIYDAKPERRARKAELERTEKRKATRKLWREKNKEPRQRYSARYEGNYNDRRKELHHQKQANDPQYRLRRALRSSLKQAIKNNQRGGSAIKLLGCSIGELRLRLEKCWLEGMTWNNFGRLNGYHDTWQIDHILPLSSFDLTDPKQVAIACHYTNLAPLWAIDNRRKANKTIGRLGVSYVF